MSEFWVAFGVIFVAELGDKSQLIALTFATRFPPWKVLIGISAATALMLGVSVAVGHLVAVNLPERLTGLVAGTLFLIFAWLTFRESGHDDHEETGPGSRFRWPILVVGVSFLLAELGDKTMLATMTLASQQAWLPTWLGATLGMISVNAIAVLVGSRLGARIPERVLAVVASALFAIVGVLLIVEALVD